MTAFLLATQPAKRVAHDDVGEEGERGPRALRRLDDRPHQARVVEQRVDAVVAQGVLGALVLLGAAAGDQAQHELRVVSSETLSDVRKNHEILRKLVTPIPTPLAPASCLVDTVDGLGS